MDKMLFRGRQGKLIKLIDLSSGHESAELPPKIEISTSDLFAVNPMIVINGNQPNKMEFLCQEVEKIYQVFGKYGHFDDVILVSKHDLGWNVFYSIEFIGHFGFPKPGMASDLVPIFKDANGQYFYVGVIRKFPPAKKMPALIGGFRECKNLHFDTVVENIIDEAKDEVGIEIFPVTGYLDGLSNVPYIDSLQFKGRFKAKKEIWFDATMVMVGSVYPETNEAEKIFGEKRVSETCACAFLTTLDISLSEETLKKLLVPGDDALDSFVWNISEKGAPPLALPHHREIFEKAIEKLEIGEMR